jgi:hypothetical protein
MGRKNIIRELADLNGVLMIAITLVVIFGLLAGPLAGPVAAQPPSCDNSYTTVEFLSETCADSPPCTWEYRVCQYGFALSHWLLARCPCFESHIVEVGYIDAQNNKTVLQECTEAQTTPCWEFGLDPITGLFGLKWDNLPGPENECWTLYFTIDEDIAGEEIDWASKFAACDPGAGTVIGPVCSCGCSELLAFKYYDVNQDGKYDYESSTEENPVGDYPLEGWEICLDDSDCRTTDENGFVDFGCVSQGEHQVCETPGTVVWINSEPGGGTLCYNVTMEPGEQLRLHFGNYDPQPQSAYIRAGKYYDYNHDGQCNGPCCPLNEWEICLNGDCKVTHDYCMLCGGCTDYWEVEPGTYTLCETAQAGWVNSDPGVAPYCKEVTVKAGDFLCVPFGNWEPPGEVGGEAYPVNRLVILAPWITLAAAIVAAVALVRRHWIWK